QELTRWSIRLCEHTLPPTQRLVANIAEEICERQPSKNWSAQFVERHKQELDSRYLKTIELVRSKNESRASYAQFFNIIGKKVQKYKIKAKNIYTIDKMGFMIASLKRTRCCSLESFMSNAD
ncbi:hypothetical protein M433DRAFT_77873, partial [Acidomyces richmondensis BFW]